MNIKSLCLSGVAILSLTILLSGCSFTNTPDKAAAARSATAERSHIKKAVGYDTLTAAATQWTQAISKKDWKTACSYIADRALVDTISKFGDCSTKGLAGWLNSVGASPDLYSTKYTDWSIAETNINEELDRPYKSVQLGLGKESKKNVWVTYKNGWSKQSIMPTLSYTNKVGWQVIGLEKTDSKK
jgi:hypothetical protein